MQVFHELVMGLRRLLTQPVGELSRAQRRVRSAIDLGRHAAQQLARDRAAEMAAALTYRTIFSLVPVIVMSMLVFRAFVSLDEAKSLITDKVYAYLNITAIAVGNTPPPPSDGPKTGPAGPDAATPKPGPSGPDSAPLPDSEPATADLGGGELRDTIDARINEITDRAYQLSFKSIGGIGVALLIWAALAMVINLEQCFNIVTESPRGRPWHLRIPIYWAVITLGPVLLLVSLYLAGAAVGLLSDVPVLGTVVRFASGFTAFGASWLLLFLLYVLMPATKIKLRPAAIGGFIAAVLWELGKWGFKLYVTKAVPYSALYGTLGLIPLFLFWLYITWLIVLFGLELTWLLQSLRGRQLAEQQRRAEERLIGDPKWIVPIMVRIGRAFEEGRTVGVGELCERLDLPRRAVVGWGERLQSAGFLREVEGTDGALGRDAGYTLARPAQRIDLTAMLAVGQAVTAPADPAQPTPDWRYVATLDDALRRVSTGKTLGDLLRDGP